MRRLDGLERAMLAIAVVFFVVGFVKIIYPTEDIVIHQVYRNMGAYIEHVSRNGSRVYGVLSILIAAGLAWMVLYGRRE